MTSQTWEALISILSCPGGSRREDALPDMCRWGLLTSMLSCRQTSTWAFAARLAARRVLGVFGSAASTASAVRISAVSEPLPPFVSVAAAPFVRGRSRGGMLERSPAPTVNPVGKPAVGAQMSSTKPVNLSSAVLERLVQAASRTSTEQVVPGRPASRLVNC